MPSVLSLFSGAGGIDLGLEAAGFDLVGAIELDPNARKTLALNRPGWPLLEPSDVFEFAELVHPSTLGLKLGELDLLVGGPPCQPFSKAAQWQSTGRRGTRDERASCIDAMARVAAKLHPKLILVENVPGFVRRPNSGLARLEHQLADVHRSSGVRYRLHSTVLRAEEYGVPQLRQRGVVVAVREDLARPFEWPKRVPLTDQRRAGDALFGLRVAAPPAASGRWATLLPSIPAGSNYMFHTPDGGGEPLFGARTRFWSFLLKLHPARPAWTLPASPGPGTGPFHWDSRPLAVDEMARLQTFPLGWRFEGTQHVGVRQVGNAAPPLLVEHIGRALMTTLGKAPPPDIVHAIAKQKVLAVAPRRRKVPVDFESRRAAHPRHEGTGMGPRPRDTRVG